LNEQIHRKENDIQKLNLKIKKLNKLHAKTKRKKKVHHNTVTFGGCYIEFDHHIKLGESHK